jgi:hypothetical protein
MAFRVSVLYVKYATKFSSACLGLAELEFMQGRANSCLNTHIPTSFPRRKYDMLPLLSNFLTRETDRRDIVTLPGASAALLRLGKRKVDWEGKKYRLACGTCDAKHTNA